MTWIHSAEPCINLNLATKPINHFKGPREHLSDTHVATISDCLLMSLGHMYLNEVSLLLRAEPEARSEVLSSF